MSSSHQRAIRLRVLLDEFYAEGDHRRKALVILQKSWTTVAQLQQHIRTIFRLPGPIYLTIEDGCLLPGDEDIGVVSELDSITVRPVRTSCNLLADAFSNAHIYSANETTPGEWTSDISSPGIFGSQSATKRQRRPQPAAAAAAASQLASSPSKTSCWIKDVDRLDDDSDTDEKPPPLSVSGTGTVELPFKPKRQRKRKRKATTAAAQPAQPAPAPAAASVQQQPGAGSRLPADVKPESEQAAIFRVPRVCLSPGHIRFEDSADVAADTPNFNQLSESSSLEDTKTSTPSAAPAKNTTRLNPFALPGTARVIRGTCMRNATRAMAVHKSAAAADTASPSVASPSVASPSGVRPSTPHDWRSAAAAAKSEEPKLSGLETLRRNVHNMQLSAVDKPLLDKDMVAFRIMKLSADYMPGMSEYIIGMVQSVDAASGMISLHIMAGHEQTQEPQGKFSLEVEDAMDGSKEASADRTFCVQRANMHDAKYVEL